MTSYKLIITLMLVVLATTSCKKDWFDTTSSAEIRAEEQFRTEGGFKDALMGAYIGMTHPSLYARDMTWNLVDILSQQYNPLPGTALYGDLQQYNYKSIRGMPKVDELWNRAYNVIANINSALSYIDKNKSVLDPINYSIIKGELLGLRAMLHFDLMRLYGYGNIANRPEVGGKMAIPYVTQFAKEITPQRSYAETFQLLEKDLADALELLKEDPVYPDANRPANYFTNVNRDGFYDKREQRMNYYAVRALQARVFQWQGTPDKMENARGAAEDVIQHSHAKLITPATSPASDRLLQREHIFNLNVAAFINVVSNFFDAQNVTNRDALFLTSGSAQSLYETQNVNIGVADKRYHTLLESQARGMAPVKLAQRAGSVIDVMPLIRISEMYYIAAEQYISTNLPKAIEYLNAVRASRGILQPISNAADENTVRQELLKEYRKEFISEGQLFFYYKRTGRTTFPGLPVNVVANDKIYLIPYPNSEVEFGNRVQ